MQRRRRADPPYVHRGGHRVDCIRAKAPFGTEYASVWRTEAIGRKEPSMILIGCDFHPSWQQVCWLNMASGETNNQKLVHSSGDAEKFYRQLPAPVRVGIEATGNCQWVLELLGKLGHEVWVRDAEKIRACDPRQQKHDPRDARLLLQLLVENRFPRIWTPSSEEKDLRQLLLHRYKLVRMRVQVKNELQHLAMNKGITKGRRLWSAAGEKVLCELPLAPWASRRREDLLRLRSILNEQIAGLDEAVEKVAEQNDRARLLMTQPGVGPITSMGLCADDGRRLALSPGQAGGRFVGVC